MSIKQMTWDPHGNVTNKGTHEIIRSCTLPWYVRYLFDASSGNALRVTLCCDIVQLLFDSLSAICFSRSFLDITYYCIVWHHNAIMAQQQISIVVNKAEQMKNYSFYIFKMTLIYIVSR